MPFNKKFKKSLGFIYDRFQEVACLLFTGRRYNKSKSFNRKGRKDFAQSTQRKEEEENQESSVLVN
jgi:hypothetical protein